MSTAFFLQYRDSGRAGLGDEEEFQDVLEERRRSSDLGFALRTFNPQPLQNMQPCSPAELNKAVLESQYLRYMAKEVGRWDLKRCDIKVSLCCFCLWSQSFLLPSSSDRHGDWIIDGGSERGGLWDFGGNVSKPAVGVYQADGLHAQQGVQETLHRRLCQHGGTQHG